MKCTNYCDKLYEMLKIYVQRRRRYIYKMMTHFMDDTQCKYCRQQFHNKHQRPNPTSAVFPDTCVYLMFWIHIEQETRPRAGIDLWMNSCTYYWNENDKINGDCSVFCIHIFSSNNFKINRKQESRSVEGQPRACQIFWACSKEGHFQNGIAKGWNWSDRRDWKHYLPANYVCRRKKRKNVSVKQPACHRYYDYSQKRLFISLCAGQLLQLQ